MRIWDVQTGQVRRTFSSHDERVQAVVFLADGSVASSGADNVIRIWDPMTGETIQELSGHTSSVWSLAVSSDNSLLASTATDRTIRL